MGKKITALALVLLMAVGLAVPACGEGIIKGDAAVALWLKDAYFYEVAQWRPGPGPHIGWEADGDYMEFGGVLTPGAVYRVLKINEYAMYVWNANIKGAWVVYLLPELGESGANG